MNDITKNIELALLKSIEKIEKFLEKLKKEPELSGPLSEE